MRLCVTVKTKWSGYHQDQTDEIYLTCTSSSFPYFFFLLFSIFDQSSFIARRERCFSLWTPLRGREPLVARSEVGVDGSFSMELLKEDDTEVFKRDAASGGVVGQSLAGENGATQLLYKTNNSSPNIEQRERINAIPKSTVFFIFFKCFFFLNRMAFKRKRTISINK